MCACVFLRLSNFTHKHSASLSLSLAKFLSPFSDEHEPNFSFRRRRRRRRRRCRRSRRPMNGTHTRTSKNTTTNNHYTNLLLWFNFCSPSHHRIPTENRFSFGQKRSFNLHIKFSTSFFSYFFFQIKHRMQYHQ